MIRFAEMLQIARLFGGKVEAEMPSGKPIHGSRLFNRRLAKARIFMPGKRKRFGRRGRR